MKIDIDYSSCLHFLSKDQIIKETRNSLKYHETLLNGTGAGNKFLGWLNLPEESISQVEAIMRSARRLRSQADVTVMVGIGGSYLGAKAVIEALDVSKTVKNDVSEHKVIFAGHNISEDYLAHLVSHLTGKSFNIIVISKSGTTTEPAIAFRIIRKVLEEQLPVDDVKNHIIAITDSTKGALRELSSREGYESYIIPDDVGGRYSVLTPVGLLPIAVAGYNIKALLEGAQEMAVLTRDNKLADNNPALLYAAIRNLLYKEGKLIDMLVNYEPALHYIAEWWKQLFGESEGKQGKGIFPASADLTTDLHSLGQYIQEGERILMETVLSVKNSANKITIPYDKDNLDNLNYISGKRLSEVNSKAEEGTIMAHVDGGVPVLRIIIPEINENMLGQLLYFFEISCAVSGYILGINPFNQPGVEAYKKNMFRLLGKQG